VEPNRSNTATAHEETDGRRVEVKDNCILDLNTIKSDEGEDGIGERR
jgi:hypothetical protein